MENIVNTVKYVFVNLKYETLIMISCVFNINCDII